MRLIKTRPRYHCDFCSHTSTKAAMESHERICWMNPDRHCPSCNDTGFYPRSYDEEPEECWWCKKLHADTPAAELHPKLAAVFANGGEDE